MNLRPLVAAGLFPISFFARAQEVPSAPVTRPEPDLAAPAFVEAVTFKSDSSGDRHTLTVLSAPRLVRVEAPDDRLSIIYDPATQHYIGLENSNYTYWEFTWPEVRDAVEGSARYATRLRDLGPQLMEENEIAPPATNSDPALGNTAPPTDSVSGDDDSGYVWKPTTDKKRIGGFDCVHWTGETVAGETIDAWCAAGLQAPIEQAIATLKEMNEPMALVPVREFLEPIVFVAWGALTKAGVTPLLLTWGGDTDANRFEFVSAKEREGKVSYFQIPKLYRKTTLATMDGIGNQKAIGTHREPAQPPTQAHHDSALPFP